MKVGGRVGEYSSSLLVIYAASATGSDLTLHPKNDALTLGRVYRYRGESSKRTTSMDDKERRRKRSHGKE